MAQVQIDVLGDFRDGRNRFSAGDRVTVPSEDAERFCANGWAKAVNGEFPTGERKVIRAVVTPHTGVLNQQAGEAG